MELSDDTLSEYGRERKACGSAEKRRKPRRTLQNPSISPEKIFELFSARQRCLIFAYLENTDDGRASVSGLVSYVSQHPCADDSPSDVKIQLQHVHLPKIAEAGLLDYDCDGDNVQYIGHPLVEDCLEVVENENHFD